MKFKNIKKYSFNNHKLMNSRQKTIIKNNSIMKTNRIYNNNNKISRKMIIRPIINKINTFKVKNKHFMIKNKFNSKNRNSKKGILKREDNNK